MGHEGLSVGMGRGLRRKWKIQKILIPNFPCPLFFVQRRVSFGLDAWTRSPSPTVRCRRAAFAPTTATSRLSKPPTTCRRPCSDRATLRRNEPSSATPSTTMTMKRKMMMTTMTRRRKRKERVSPPIHRLSANPISRRSHTPSLSIPNSTRQPRIRIQTALCERKFIHPPLTKSITMNHSSLSHHLFFRARAYRNSWSTKNFF